MTNTTMVNARTNTAELSNLDQATQDKIMGVVAASKAANTLRAYKSDLRQVAKYLADTGHRSLLNQVGDTWQLIKPMSAALVSAYLVERAEQGTALASLQRHVASLSKWHQIIDANTPGATNPCATQLVRDTVAGLRKQNQRKPKRAPAITPAQLGSMVQGLELDTLRGLRDRAIILLGWAGGLRRSEIANLNWSNIEFVGEGMRLTIMQQKIDTPEHQQIGVPYQTKKELCPVLAMLAWARACQVKTYIKQPVFVRIGQFGDNLQVSLSGQAIGNIVSVCAIRVGLDGYTAHSLRAGLITEAILQNRPEHEVMGTSRHKSQTVFRTYVRHAELFTKSASRGLLS